VGFRVAILLLASIGCLARAVRAAEIVLSPVVEAQWTYFDRTQAYPPYPRIPSLDTRGGDRSVLVFDLSGIDLARVTSLTLGLTPVQSLPDMAVLQFEAIGLDQARIDLDPFVYTLYSPLSAGPVPQPIAPCNGAPLCPIVPIPNPTNSPQGFFFEHELDQPYVGIPADVSASIAALDGGHRFLQLNLIPVLGGVYASGLQFGHTGLGEPAALVVQTPEPLELTQVCLSVVAILVLASVRTANAWSESMDDPMQPECESNSRTSDRGQP